MAQLSWSDHISQKCDQSNWKPYDPSLKRYIRTVSPDGMKDNGFCTVCNSIDFAEIAAIDMSRSKPYDRSGFGIDNYRTVFYLPNLAETSSSPSSSSRLNCPMCAMFSLARDYVYGGESSKILKNLRLVQMEFAYASPVALAVIGIYKDITSSLIIDPFPETLGSFPATLDFWQAHRRYSKAGAQCGNLRVDCEWILSQIRACQDRHDHLASPNTTVPDMQLIDCRDLTVVDAPVQPDYLALSYVWGRDDPISPGEKMDPHPLTIAGFAGQVTWTIADAIRLTLGMKKRYLWVDCYCIRQNDPTHVKQQLQLMGRIFGGAWVTIVAMGKNNRAPLPGVSVNRRAPSFASVPAPGGGEGDGVGWISMSHKAQYGYQIKQSVWNTRGWTFQERIMSPRIIYCCENEVFVACSRAVVSETFGLSDGRGRQMNHFGVYQYPDFRSAAKDYTGRKLTNQKDAFDAFRGYLGESEQATYWAVPIYASSKPVSHDGSKETGFAMGILWYHGIPDEREDEQRINAKTSHPVHGEIGLPSWSWISCRWPVNSLALFEDLDSWYFVRHCDILIEASSQGQGHPNLMPCSDLFELPHREGESLMVPEQTRYLHIRSALLSYRLLHSTKVPEYWDYEIMWDLHFCALGELDIFQDKSKFHSVCFYPDFGHIGAATMAEFQETGGNAIFVGTLRNDGTRLWTENFCFLALKKERDGDCFERVGMIVASTITLYFDRFDDDDEEKDTSNPRDRETKSKSDTEENLNALGEGDDIEEGAEGQISDFGRPNRLGLRKLEAISKEALDALRDFPVETVRVG